MARQVAKEAAEKPAKAAEEAKRRLNEQWILKREKEIQLKDERRLQAARPSILKRGGKYH